MPHRRARRLVRLLLVAVLAAALALAGTTAAQAGHGKHHGRHHHGARHHGHAAQHTTPPSVQPPAADPVPLPVDPKLGDHVLVFDPSMTTASIQAAVDQVAAQQVDAEFGSDRWALLFEPGTYGADTPLVFQVGYYTEVAGLGLDPGDTVIHGKVEVYNRCLAPDNCLALDNFWRSVSNLTVDVAGGSGCRAAMFWAVSQAAPMRRVRVNGQLSLMDYCTAGPQYASGGFIADSDLNSSVINGSQQQFLVRNSSIDGWSNGVWNQVFAGVEGAPTQGFPNPPYTTLPTTPVSKERPFLYVDEAGAYRVFVPSAQRDSAGTTWAAGTASGTSYPLRSFHIARPGDSVASMNAALALGKHLLLTPGQYAVDRSIRVLRPGAVVLGLGLPTLTAVGGAVPMVVSGRGADVAGLMIDAGPVSSRALLHVRSSGLLQAFGQLTRRPAPVTALQDVFFRVGGAQAGRADVSLLVDADHVVLDDVWAWRADHGNGVGWTVNPARNGVVVDGDDVTATGLFVEHYQQFNVIWNGEGGRTVMFQNELPYDPPDQAAWGHDGVPGWAGYKVADDVQTHELWGGGSYVFTSADPSIHAAHGFEVPVRPGVRLHDLLTAQLGAGTLDHVVNDVGAPVDSSSVGQPSTVVSYP